MLVPLALSARLNDRQTAIVQIASRTAAGSLDSLYASLLDKALDSTLTVNEAKDVMVHSYTYCGFLRALQGLKTLVRVLDDRKSRGVVFDPAAHNDWHRHPGGQILIATSGKGYYQERGKPLRVLMPGDVVAIAPDVEHWHGAAADSPLMK